MLLRLVKIKNLNQIIGNLIVIPFEALEKEFNLKLDEFEDILFDGNDAGLFKLKIDYISNQLKFSHFKKRCITHENVVNLKSKITNLREKINSFINKIDLLA